MKSWLQKLKVMSIDCIPHRDPGNQNRILENIKCMLFILKRTTVLTSNRRLYEKKLYGHLQDFSLPSLKEIDRREIDSSFHDFAIKIDSNLLCSD